MSKLFLYGLVRANIIKVGEKEEKKNHSRSLLDRTAYAERQMNWNWNQMPKRTFADFITTIGWTHITNDSFYTKLNV